MSKSHHHVTQSSFVGVEQRDARLHPKLTHRRVFRYARNIFGAIKGYEGVFGNVNPALWATSMRHRRRIDRALPNTVVDPGGRPLYH